MTVGAAETASGSMADGPPGPGVTRRPFGMLANGAVVEAVTLVNRGGMAVTIITLGASMQSVVVPDRDGRPGNAALGHATLAPYRDTPHYSGAIVGRVANRIAGGQFTLDGRDHRVPANNGPNVLHGGPAGFDAANWSIIAIADAPVPAVTLAHVSPDGDQGFPGTLHVTATYMLDDDNRLTLDLTGAADAPTLVALSSHTYWNLAGEGSAAGAMGHVLHIDADAFLPTDATLIPTGERRDVTDSAFDFRTPRMIGERVRDAGDEQIRLARGYDHNWVLNPAPDGGMRTVARLADPASGRAMTLSTDQPGLQFYSGNFMDGSIIGASGRAYRQGDGIALEPQAFPDTANQPAFGSIRLDPGQVYRNRMAWHFTVHAKGEGA